MWKTCDVDSVLWHLSSREFLFSYSIHLSDMRKCESPLPVLSGVKAHFSCLGECQKRTMFLRHAILPQLFDVWTHAVFLSFFSSFPAATNRSMTWECVNLHCQAQILNTSFNLGRLGAETGRDILFQMNPGTVNGGAASRACQKLLEKANRHRVKSRARQKLLEKVHSVASRACRKFIEKAHRVTSRACQKLLQKTRRKA